MSHAHPSQAQVIKYINISILCDFRCDTTWGGGKVIEVSVQRTWPWSVDKQCFYQSFPLPLPGPDLERPTNLFPEDALDVRMMIYLRDSDIRQRRPVITVPQIQFVSDIRVQLSVLAN